MSASAEARALTAAQPTATLIVSLRAVASPASIEERMVRAWIIDTLETRFPIAGRVVQETFEAAERKLIASGDATDYEEIDYVAVLLAAIPEAEAR